MSYMELDCVISNQMKDYRLIHSVKFQDHITNTLNSEMACACMMDTSPRHYVWTTGKNNRFPFLDILGSLKNTHKNPKFGKVRQVPTREFPTKFPGWDLSHFQIWDFCGYYLNTLKYPKMGICYFFLCG